MVLHAAAYLHLLINAILCWEPVSGGHQSQKLGRRHAKVAPVVSFFWGDSRAVFVGDVTASFKQI